MNDVHCSHSTSSIVEDPLLVQVNVAARQLLAQFPGDEGDDSGRVIAMSSNSTQREVMKVRWVQDVEPVEVRVQVSVQNRQEREHDREYGCFLGEGAWGSSRS